MLRLGCLIGFLCAALNANAALDIEITGAGEHQVPISIVPFGGDEAVAKKLAEVISSDLLRTGLFKLVNPAGRVPHQLSEVKFVEWSDADALTIGTVTSLPDGRVQVRFRLLDTVKNSELVGQAITAKSEQLRAIAHRIADMIYQKLTGSPGVFSTRIAYINRDAGQYRLVVADSDGDGEQTLLSSRSPIISPSWSPDGARLSYVSFEQGRAIAYAQSLQTRQRQVLASFPGSNSSPVWSPDGKQLALVLTFEGSSELYMINNDGTNLRRLTYSESIDTEPSFSPDGKYLLFTSDRGGSAQVYRMSTEGGEAERLTYEGSNNYSPRFSPDGKSFVFAHVEAGVFYIAVQDFESKQMQILTQGGWEKKPSFAPNGKLVLFATEVQGRGILATVSSDGRVKQKMTPQRGDIREPMWGPALKQ
jgi:TolB protein